MTSIVQHALDWHLAAIRMTGRSGQAARALSGMWRAACVRAFGDPQVRSQIAGVRLTMNLSHELPVIAARFPDYSRNLGRLARLVAAKYPDGRIVDIGANIGDSVAVIRAETGTAVLCIEGSREYAVLLRRNVEQWSDVYVEVALVGDHDPGHEAVLRTEAGTGGITRPPSPANGGLKNREVRLMLRPLPEILTAYPAFETDTRLLKIDTDGYDSRIIAGSQEWLRLVHPVVFFEYDPHFMKRLATSSLTVFEVLRASDYRRILVWDNTGEFMMSLDLECRGTLADLAAFYTGRDGERYCDIAAFHHQDLDLAEQLRLAERARRHLQ